MEVSSARRGGHTLVTVNAPRIDASTAIRFKDAVRQATAGDTGPVILDLGQVAFVDSSGLGAIVATMKHMGPARRLDLAGLTPDVAKVFRLTRMETVFRIHASAEAALKRDAG